MTTNDGIRGADGPVGPNVPSDRPASPEVRLPDPELVEAARLDEAPEIDEPTEFRPGKSILFAGLFGSAGALIWATITALTNYELGLVAIVLGVLAGNGAARGGRGRPAQLIGAGMTAVCFMFAKFLTIVFVFVANPQALQGQSDGTSENGTEASVDMAAAEPGTSDLAGAPSVDVGDVSEKVDDASPEATSAATPGESEPEPAVGIVAFFVGLMVALIVDTFSGMGILFFGIAVWQGFQQPRAQVEEA